MQQTDPPSASGVSDADYVQSSTGRTWRWFAGFFGGWVLTGLGVFCRATGYAPLGQSRVSYEAAWEASSRARSGRPCSGWAS
ncbi:hypothetical protein [Streptomyces sp. JW3]|uniref:hypothetical protein n=1 Tax=Streptomyces sp. JW3 TaxID=3456955 RepID=UPI003FA48FC7